MFSKKDESISPEILSLCQKLNATDVGKNVQKRQCILCGVCRKEKCYALTRTVTQVGSVYTCSSCQHFVEDVLKTSAEFNCEDSSQGKCFIDNVYMPAKCKVCRILQIMENCGISKEMYDKFSERLSEDCKVSLLIKKLLQGQSTNRAKSHLKLQYLKDDAWVEFKETSSEDESSELETVPPSPTESMQFEDQSMDIYDEEAIIDDPDPISRQTARDATKSSERIRKKKQVNYIQGKKRGKKCIYGPDGKILKNGIDLCDCLQSKCPGCHFPCPKCRSPKCGNECRVNRRWYYEKVEIEGTSISFPNKWVQSLEYV